MKKRSTSSRKSTSRSRMLPEEPQPSDFRGQEDRSSKPKSFEAGEILLGITLATLPRLPSDERTLEEQRFMFEDVPRLVPAPMTWDDIGKKVRGVLDDFAERETFNDAPFAAIRHLGLDALRPSQMEDLPIYQPRPGSTSRLDSILRDLALVRSLVWGRVGRWREEAVSAPSLKERREATDRLRRFGRMLVPDTRGKRQSAISNPRSVYFVYRQLLYRLRLARELLAATTPAGKTHVPQSRIDEVVQESGLPAEWIRDWLFFADRLERKPRSLTAEQRARDLTADLFQIEPESLANLLSRRRAGVSSKQSQFR